MRKRIYIAYTGGTFGMKKSVDGYVPVGGYLYDKLKSMDEINSKEMPHFDFNEYSPLIDSSNMTPQYWAMIAKDIESHYDEYDGFIVIHGTDTMAYTASALSFMFENLQKPVIFTGSQIPICEIRNDAKENIITSLMIAANYKIPEVCIYFGNKLMRGNRTVKMDADGFKAFHSPNYPLLGEAGININIDKKLIRKKENSSDKFSVRVLKDMQIGTLRLFPGIAVGFIEKILESPLKGLVIEGYGAGNGPVANPEFIRVLKNATERGVIIAASTQCTKGVVDLKSYQTGTLLEKAGLIGGYDMTTEALIGKLFYLLSIDGLSNEKIKEMMQQNLRGEMLSDLQ